MVKYAEKGPSELLLKDMSRDRRKVLEGKPCLVVYSILGPFVYAVEDVLKADGDFKDELPFSHIFHYLKTHTPIDDRDNPISPKTLKDFPLS